MPKKELLHVLGGGPWQVPTVRLAKRLGYRVLVTDIYPERPAYALADAHEVVDIADPVATLEAARRHRIGGILCDTTDIGVPTAAYVAEKLGLPGIGVETALNCTRKDRMRQATERAGLAVPRHRLIVSEQDLGDVAAELDFPLVVKPVDGQSGRGVSRVTNRTQLRAAFRHARVFTRAKAVLIEAWIAGTEIIVDGFVVGGKVKVLGVSRKVPYEDNPTIAARITYPGGFSDAALRRIEDANRRALGAVGLMAGVFHAEYMVCHDRIVPIDIAARGGGCMIYTHVIPHISGVDANSAMIENAMGKRVHIRRSSTARAANVEYLRMPQGTLAAIKGVEAAAAFPGVAAIYIGVAVGDRIGDLQKKDDRPGYFVAVGDTAAEVVATSLAAKSRIRVLLAGSRQLVAVT